MLTAAIPPTRPDTAEELHGPAAADTGRLPFATAARWAAIVAVLMSTQYLIQPFVWSNWPLDDVLAGWIEVLCNRAVVAMSIALALVIATRAGARSLAVRASLVGAAIVTGAAVGEAILLVAGAPGARSDAAAVLGAIVQWTGLSLCVAGMYYLWTRNNEARMRGLDNELARSRAEALRVRTELQSLRQQIDPHFLFNTLATIRRLKETDAETDTADGTRLLGHLIDHLQSTARASDQHVTLGEEVDLARSHLAIVAIRMSGRLTLQFDVPEELYGCACPPLTLATLVENAVRHGITPSHDGGTIAVRARRHNGALEIRVEDTGVGMTFAKPGYGGAGIGLTNIRARLRALYGNEASLSISANVPRGVRAVIRLPLHRVDRAAMNP